MEKNVEIVSSHLCLLNVGGRCGRKSGVARERGLPDVVNQTVRGLDQRANIAGIGGG